MHGIGSVTSFQAMSSGGCIVTLASRVYDPVELLDTIERERVTTVALVGDVMTRPLVEALDASPGRWDLSSLRIMSSSGAMWSASVKEALLRHAERLVLVDTLGSSESVGMAASLTTTGGTASTGRFAIGEDTRVITADGRFVEPGSGEEGLVSKRGHTSFGYYKDPDKTSATYRVIDGVRWMTPGDVATVESDGTITLLGRGSGCINTGGEKVFPEEVEEALKGHPAVRDAAVVGIPDERFGEVVAAVVEPEPGGAAPDPDALTAHVRERLAPYKAPRRILVVPSIDRLVTGKHDYKRWKEALDAESGR
jgi:acyl-CoA synthetase (AMP-forming)/AMP-acid ligase II